MKLIVFDFIIQHRSKKTNFVDESLKRLNYYNNVNTKIQRLLSTLQKKLQMINMIKTSKKSNINQTYVIIFHVYVKLIENDILKFENKIIESKFH